MKFLKLQILISLLPLLLLGQNEKMAYKKLDRSLKLIESQYVDSVNSDELVVKAIEAMIQQLDPHSKYQSTEEYQKNNEILNSSFGGIGVNYQILNDTPIVLSVVPSSPAEAVGLKAGDRLLKVNGVDILGPNVTNSYISKQIRGEVGSTLLLNIRPNPALGNRVSELTLSRANIPIKTIISSYPVNKELAYIKVSSFSKTSATDFQLAVFSFKAIGINNFIVDLRDNSGGLMMAAIQMAGVFLKDGDLIVYTQGINSPRTDYNATGDGEMTQGKLIVMVDENSASASEIFAGAIQDHDRGLIVGRRSYGKGLVGRNYLLPDGSALRLTTGRYYTPSGRCIQKPYEMGQQGKYNKELESRYLNGEVYNKDSLNATDTSYFITKNGRKVNAAGGISPDHFVALDTSFYSPLLKAVLRQGLVNLYAGIYFDKNLFTLKSQYPNATAFIQNFKMSDYDFNAFNQWIKTQKGIAPDLATNVATSDYLRNNFKAILARNLYQEGYFYQITNEMDAMYNSSVQLIKTQKLYQNYLEIK